MRKLAVCAGNGLLNFVMCIEGTEHWVGTSAMQYKISDQHSLKCDQAYVWTVSLRCSNLFSVFCTNFNNYSGIYASAVLCPGLIFYNVFFVYNYKKYNLPRM